jgi:dipeptidyl aminopeptidase/acylaminoacyl peptidase
MRNLTYKRLFVFLALLIFIPLGAFLVIKLAQGYRPDFSDWTLSPSGLLVATSTPNGAQLFIDGKLTSATNTTLRLSPGEYEIEIKKDGFVTWKKTLPIKKELVTKADAFLFPTFPDLRPLTFTGTANPAISPDGQKVVFAVADTSGDKNGLWILDLADRPLGFPREPRQIVRSAPRGRDFSKSTYVWSPDSKEILVTLKDRPGVKIGQLIEENFLLDASQLNADTNLVDITSGLPRIFQRWEEEKKLKEEAKLSELPEELLMILQDGTKDIVFSPDETKILYTATASASIPKDLIPPLPAPNPQPESRDLEPERIYVYDLEEDKNFYLMDEDKSKILSWFPTSKHLFLVQNDKITVLEYDSTNWTDIYSGPFENSFAFPFPSGNKILILTTLGKDTPPNLYAINLR